MLCQFCEGEIIDWVTCPDCGEFFCCLTCYSNHLRDMMSSVQDHEDDEE